MIHAQLHTGLKAGFELLVSGPRGARVYKAPNLVTDAGIDRYMTSNGGVFTSVQIGTGTASPAVTDTALQNRIASTSTLVSGPSCTYVAGPPDYVEVSLTYRFPIGALNSSVSGNFAEVGIGWATTGSLWSRARITDGGGSPTTISVLVDEQLDVIYRIRYYPIQSDITGSVVLNGSSYDYVIRPMGLSDVSGNGLWGANGSTLAGGSSPSSSYTNTQSTQFGLMRGATGSIAARTTSPTGFMGQAADSGREPVGSYTNGSRQRTVKFTLGVSSSVGSLKTAMFSLGTPNTNGWFAHQIEFTPAINKLNTQRLTLDFTYSLANRP